MAPRWTGSSEQPGSAGLPLCRSTSRDLERTLGESVGVGYLPRLGDDEWARAALGRAGAAGLAQKLPDGSGSSSGERSAGSTCPPASGSELPSPAR